MPVGAEVLFGESGPLGSTGIVMGRTEQSDVPLLFGAVDTVRGDAAAGDDVVCRLEALRGQAVVDAVESVDVLLRSRPGYDLHDHVRAGVVAGLALVIAAGLPGAQQCLQAPGFRL
ncbi:hypothetical protein [Streptomyces sp. NPDC058989]|uniref:hypothetical protein n=1 Tax=Streptomyces sp. NPDC058989 TaxID=3346686 RepID=UPI0036CA5B03